MVGPEGLTNAFNLLDNMDGLLTGVALIAALPADFPYAFVAKRELKDHFVSRIFLNGIGVIFVERFDARQVAPFLLDRLGVSRPAHLQGAGALR